MYKKILIPVDGSSKAEIVIPYAEEFSAKFEAELILASVSEPEIPEMTSMYRSYLEHLTENMQRQLSERGVDKKARVSIEVLIGKPATEILQYADDNNVDLIAMASRGGSHGGPDEGAWLLGNIASKIVQAANQPIFLIRTPANSQALRQKRLLKKILVPLDGSEVGEAAITHVEALAQSFNAQVILFHVLELAPVPVLVAPGIKLPYPSVTPEQEAHRAITSLTYLERVEKALKEKGMNCSSEISSGSPAVEVLKFAEASAIDLIAISTHGRSGIGRWVFGSVTEKLLQTGSTPVLTVRQTTGL